MVSLTVDIPDGIDPKEFQANIDWKIRELKAKHEWQTVLNNALQSSEGLREWMKYVNVKNKAVIVRASTYENVSTHCECFPPDFWGDPRRPVLMKGSREALILKYGHSNHYVANGYAKVVFLRWLKKKKHTEFYIPYPAVMPFDECERVLWKHFNDRSIGLSYHVNRFLDCYRPRPQGSVFSQSWVNGKVVRLTNNQETYLKKMYSIIKKTKDIDKRMQLLRNCNE